MKKLKYSLLIVMLGVSFSVVNTWSGSEMAKQASPDMAKAHDDTVDWEIPLTAGVYYPHKCEEPQPKMRYYRVRCWPGCHVGSDKGMYPTYPLVDDQPIYQTSTINNMRNSHSAQQD